MTTPKKITNPNQIEFILDELYNLPSIIETVILPKYLEQVQNVLVGNADATTLLHPKDEILNLLLATWVYHSGNLIQPIPSKLGSLVFTPNQKLVERKHMRKLDHRHKYDRNLYKFALYAKNEVRHWLYLALENAATWIDVKEEDGRIHLHFKYGVKGTQHSLGLYNYREDAMKRVAVANYKNAKSGV